MIPKLFQQKIAYGIRNKKYIIFIVHRQGGKSELICKAFSRILIEKSVPDPVGLLFASTLKQCRKIFKNKFVSQFKDHEPRGTYDDQDDCFNLRRIYRDTGKVFFSGATDKIESARGGTGHIIACDEFGSWTEGFAESVVFPQGDVHKAPILITGTPRGPNHFMKMYEKFERNMRDGKSFFAYKWNIDDSLKHGYITRKRYEEIKASVPSHIWQAEYMLDWYAYVPNQIFSIETAQAVKDERFGNFPHRQGYPVTTFWDIGRNGTAVWFRQTIAGNHYYFKFIDQTFKVHFQTFVKEKFLPAVFTEGMKIQYNVFPNDIHFGEWMSEAPRIEIAKKILPGNTIPMPAMKKPLEAIDFARRSFSHCYFDSKQAGEGFQRLQLYHMQENGEKPNKKDPSSHGADAFVLAQNFKDPFGKSAVECFHYMSKDNLTTQPVYDYDIGHEEDVFRRDIPGTKEYRNTYSENRSWGKG